KVDKMTLKIYKQIKCLVYTGKDIVAATVLKYDKVKEQCPDTPVEWRELLRGCPNVRTWAEFESNLCPLDVRNKNLDAMKKKNQLEDHGEYRVLQHFDTLVKRRTKKSLLLFYSWGSPCDYKCTNQNYQNNILNAIANIKKWKNYVFVFSKPYKRPPLTNLGNRIDLSNIFRCDKGNNGRTACKSCSDNGKVSDFCILSFKVTVIGFQTFFRPQFVIYALGFQLFPKQL
uniref:Uncharacterized protein n=1 Tax=Sphaeramia orbicularis TaxID=375764 RepID=A0A672Z3S6_9TELE